MHEYERRARRARKDAELASDAAPVAVEPLTKAERDLTAETDVLYEYVLVMPEHGIVGIGPTTDLRAVEQDYEAWEAETGRIGTIMRRPVADWEDMPLRTGESS